MSLYGLIGYPLTHSFSPAYFTNKFEKEGIDAVYKAYPLASITELPLLLQEQYQLAGFNVTIPYKQLVMPYLSEMDDAAKVIGAVNCVDMKNGRLKGYNTDYIGFTNSLKPLLRTQHSQALVLGSGGGSKAVTYALQKLGIDYRIVSRTGTDITYDTLTDDIVSNHRLIINTTPLGMFPHSDACPRIPYDAVTEQHLLFDLIYNPTETKFLSLGKQRGASIKNGYEMLVTQAEESWRIWNG